MFLQMNKISLHLRSTICTTSDFHLFCVVLDSWCIMKDVGRFTEKNILNAILFRHLMSLINQDTMIWIMIITNFNSLWTKYFDMFNFLIHDRRPWRRYIDIVIPLRIVQYPCHYKIMESRYVKNRFKNIYTYIYTNIRVRRTGLPSFQYEVAFGIFSVTDTESRRLLDIHNTVRETCSNHRHHIRVSYSHTLKHIPVKYWSTKSCTATVCYIKLVISIRLQIKKKENSHQIKNAQIRLIQIEIFHFWSISVRYSNFIQKLSFWYTTILQTISSQTHDIIVKKKVWTFREDETAKSSSISRIWHVMIDNVVSTTNIHV